MKFQKVGKHLFERRYKTAQGDWQTLFYARFRCELKKKPRVIALGSDGDAARNRLLELEYKNSKDYDFDLDRLRSIAPRDGKTAPFTFAEWAARYPAFDDVKTKSGTGIATNPGRARRVQRNQSRKAQRRYSRQRKRPYIHARQWSSHH
jgi:hypothetical protein